MVIAPNCKLQISTSILKSYEFRYRSEVLDVYLCCCCVISLIHPDQQGMFRNAQINFNRRLKYIED